MTRKNFYLILFNQDIHKYPSTSVGFQGTNVSKLIVAYMPYASKLVVTCIFIQGINVSKPILSTGGIIHSSDVLGESKVVY